jgi:hypothetical protein
VDVDDKSAELKYAVVDGIFEQQYATPLYVHDSEKSTDSPSTMKLISPRVTRFRPVAVTMMSASRRSLDTKRMPVASKASMRSVTTSAFPDAIAANKSPFE